MKKILIVSPVYTHPTNMGNSFAIVAQANALREIGCDVHLLYTIHNAKSPNDIKQLTQKLNLMQSYWGQNLHLYHIPSPSRILRNLKYRISSKFRNWKMDLYQLYPWGVEKKVAELQKQYNFDICIVNYVYLTKIFDVVKFPQMACFTHDTFAYKNLHAGINNLWLTAHQEAIALQKCTDVLAIQEEEMNYFKILAPTSRHYNVYTPYTYTPQPVIGNHNIVFLSGKNEFNQNGLRWFVNEVFSLIRKQFTDAKLLIAGGICKAIEHEYKDIDDIKLIGFVEDPKEFFALGDVAINPTYQGTGLKIKTFESMSYDKVTLVHPHSMAGIFDKGNAPLFASDNPQEWVEFLDGIWNNPDAISIMKSRNKDYMERYNDFIMSEYRRLTNV